MTAISHSRNDVSILRDENGWTITVANQGAETSVPQVLRIGKKSTIDDLKGLIGQVEHAARVLVMEENR